MAASQGQVIDPAELLVEIKRKSRQITVRQQAADRGEFRTMADAFGLQKLRRERAALQRLLPPLRLAGGNL